MSWCNNYLITESEVVTGKSQTEALPYWPSDSKVNTVDRGLRFSPNDRTVEVIKLFIIWHQQQLPFALFLQARNRPVGVTGE